MSYPSAGVPSIPIAEEMQGPEFVARALDAADGVCVCIWPGAYDGGARKAWVREALQRSADDSSCHRHVTLL